MTTATFTIRDGQFGCCPSCGRNDGFVTSDGNLWFICSRCRLRWWVGSTEDRTDESPEDRNRVGELLRGYRVVEPFRGTSS